MFGIDDLIAFGTNAVVGAIGGSQQYKAQKKAINTAIGTQRESLQELEPWQRAGEDALNAWREKVMAGPGEFKESEGYKFTLGEGEKAIKRAASTGAGFGTGAMGKSLIRYGQGLASNEYDAFQNRYLKSLAPYQQLAGVGQWAVGNRNAIRSSIADLQFDKGTAKANAWATAIGGVRSGIHDVVSLSGSRGGGGTPVSAPTTTPIYSQPIPVGVGSFGGGYNPNAIGINNRPIPGLNESQIGRL